MAGLWVAGWFRQAGLQVMGGLMRGAWGKRPCDQNDCWVMASSGTLCVVRPRRFMVEQRKVERRKRRREERKEKDKKSWQRKKG